MKFMNCAVIVISLLVFSMPGKAAPIVEKKAAIAASMHQQWDQPDQKLEILTIVDVSEVAIVNWILGDKGGRALLKLDEGKGLWQTYMCGGVGLTKLHQLQQAGIPLATAQELLQALRIQEQNLDAKQKALINGFQGVIKFTQEKDMTQQTHTHQHQ